MFIHIMNSLFHMSDLDRSIFEVIQDDARLSSQEIAERIGSSPSSVWRRIRAMEEAGVIAGYRVIVDAEKLGLQETILVSVGLEKHNADATAKFEEFVHNAPQILECYVGTGEHDYILKVVSKDMRSHFDFLEEGLMKLGCVRKTNSTVVMRKIKETSKIRNVIIPLQGGSSKGPTALPQGRDKGRK
jgi:Lrp/AsnC family transcriptional regulator, leucine-responsive regulatory protein